MTWIKRMKILILAEHDHQKVANATLNTITAAKNLGDDIDVLVLGNDCRVVAEQLTKVTVVKNVLLLENECFQFFTAENIAHALVSIAKNYTHILAPATTFGKNTLPRAAALLNASMISDIIGIETNDTFIRPIYAGNALCKIKNHDPIKFITVRPTAFSLAVIESRQATLQELTLNFQPSIKTTFIKLEATTNKRPELTHAKVVISGGRGLQNKENFKLIEELADCLNAAVGASRAAVDAGFVPNDLQVGQTGKVVAPDLYFAIGISGAIQHVAGIKDSKTIIAINKDPDAPIFQIADYGLVGDLFEIVPQLIENLRK